VSVSTSKAEPLVDAQTFRDAMALLPAPLTVVTTVDNTGRRWGFTASSVSSVSLDPPLLLVSVARTSSCHPAVTSGRDYVINVLGGQHRELAARFATSGVNRFAGGEFASWPGSLLPYLPDANVLLRCVTVAVTPAGDHDLLIGGLAEVRIGAGGSPLLWYRRAFHTSVGL
jgi:flavin reductase ActVB